MLLLGGVHIKAAKPSLEKLFTMLRGHRYLVLLLDGAHIKAISKTIFNLSGTTGCLHVDSEKIANLHS